MNGGLKTGLGGTRMVFWSNESARLFNVLPSFRRILNPIRGFFPVPSPHVASLFTGKYR
jgi:hypothetical protein